jgi:hypothetical protein
MAWPGRRTDQDSLTVKSAKLEGIYHLIRIFVFFTLLVVGAAYCACAGSGKLTLWLRASWTAKSVSLVPALNLQERTKSKWPSGCAGHCCELIMSDR